MMLKPCNNCPFRSDKPFYGLSKERKKEIVASLMGDGSFHCHETLDYSEGEPTITENSNLCVGSMIFLEHTRRGGMKSNVIYRLEVKFKGIKSEHLSNDIPVYESIESFINF
jgi:hypothetical protein